jgi:ribosomal protein S18 acetylase RimI-like enzyme
MTVELTKPLKKSQKSDYSIRRFAPQDYEVVKKLIQGLAALYNDDFSENIFKKYIETQLLDASKSLIVAELKGKVVGCTLVDTHRDPRGVLYGRISNVNILSEAQGNGIGGALVDKAIEFLSHLECPSIWANVNPNNEHMIRLFEHRGFNRMLKVMDKTLDPKNVVNIPPEFGDIIYRDVEKEDIQEVKTLIKELSELFEEGFDPYWFDIMIERDLKSNDAHIFVADENLKIKGSIFAEKIEDPAGNIRGYISNIMIKESMRRKGVGTYLLLKAIEYLQELKMTRIWANVKYDSQALQHLFEKHGFEMKFTVMQKRAKFYDMAFFDSMTK